MLRLPSWCVVSDNVARVPFRLQAQMVTSISCECLKLHAEADAELQQRFKERREKLEAVTSETATFALPTGNRTFVKVEKSEWDGS